MNKILTPLKALENIKTWYLFLLEQAKFGVKQDLNESETKWFNTIEKALKEYQENLMGDNCWHFVTHDDIEKYYEVEKKLKALDIIKEKRVTIPLLLNTDSLEEYNETIKHSCVEAIYKPLQLTQQEYDLLKEVLLWLWMD